MKTAFIQRWRFMLNMSTIVAEVEERIWRGRGGRCRSFVFIRQGFISHLLKFLGEVWHLADVQLARVPGKVPHTNTPMSPTWPPLCLGHWLPIPIHPLCIGTAVCSEDAKKFPRTVKRHVFSTASQSRGSSNELISTYCNRTLGI